MSPRPDVSAERKQQIMQAALAVFARKGFAETRMEDIAGAANLSKATLYLYYNSKDAIIAALLEFFFTQEMQNVQTLLESGKDTPVRAQILSMHKQLAASTEWLAQLLPVTFEFYAVAARQESVRDFLKAYFAQYRQAIAALIERGIVRGEFRPVPAEAVAIGITALYEGLTLLWMVDTQAVDWERDGLTALNLLLDGLEPH